MVEIIPRKQMRRPASTPALGTLPLEEWDFEQLIQSKGFSGRQIYACMTYEYARSSPAIVEEFWKDEAYQNRSDRMAPWHFVVSVVERDGDGNPSDVFIAVVDAPVGFPEKPYLRVCDNHRLTDDVMWPLEYSPAVRTARVGDSAALQYNLYVDWHASDRVLAKAFRAWAVANRARPPYQRRGKSDVRRDISALKALGAYRLIRHCKTAERALDYSVEKGHKHGLYSNLSDWSVAKRSAASILRTWAMFDPEWRG